MSIQIEDLESSWKTKSDEYDINDMQAYYIFRQLTHDSVLLVIVDIFDSLLKFRS